MGPIRHPARLIDQVGDGIRLKHYSIRTEQAYLGRIRRLLGFDGKPCPRASGPPKGEGRTNL
jgi:hypothetical protein